MLSSLVMHYWGEPEKFIPESIHVGLSKVNLLSGTHLAAHMEILKYVNNQNKDVLTCV